MEGRLIVFEGVDRVGKTTQYNMLAQRLRDEGHSVHTLSFPSGGTPLGKLLRQYLRGEIYLSTAAAALTFEADRWNEWSNIVEWLGMVDYVLVDRFWRSGLAYDAGRRGRDINPWLEEVSSVLANMIASREELIYLCRPSKHPIGETQEANDRDEDLAYFAAKAFDVLNSRYPPRRILDIGVTLTETEKPVPAEVIHGSIYRFVTEVDDDD